MGSPTRCGSSTVIVNTGAILVSPEPEVLVAGGEDCIHKN